MTTPQPDAVADHPGDYKFTTNWFDTVKGVWGNVVSQVKPRTYLEVGSFEGASACHLIDRISSLHPLEIHCVDTWDGGVEHKSIDMESVEGRFARNTGIAVENAANPVEIVLHKGASDIGLARLLADGKGGYFDFVYIDGSHQAPDVLLDAALGFKLLKIGGVMCFDDYIWYERLPYGKDPLRCPKPAIDAFVNLNFRKLELIRAPLHQFFIRKTAD